MKIKSHALGERRDFLLQTNAFVCRIPTFAGRNSVFESITMKNTYI